MCSASHAPVLQVSTIKDDLLEATAGGVLAEVELCMCSRAELNPVVLATMDQGEPLVKPLNVSTASQPAWRQRNRFLQAWRCSLPPAPPSAGCLTITALLCCAGLRQLSIQPQAGVPALVSHARPAAGCRGGAP